MTGGSEGVGLAVVKMLLHNGHHVVATASSSAGALTIRHTGALPVFPDLTRESEVLSTLRMAKADVVVHAAPQVFGGAPQTDFDYEAHADWLVDSTNAVVHAAGKNEVDKIISISFGYLYEGHHGEASNEDAHTVHDDGYSSMLKAEAAVLDGGVQGYVIRAGYIYGGNSHSTDKIASVIKNSRPVHSGTQSASWIHEDDLASAIVAIVEADADENTVAEIINVADDHPQSPNDFANALAEVLGLSSVGFASSGFMTVLRGETFRDKLLEREFNLDTSTIKEKYGWQPEHTSISSGLEATALSWRMNEATDLTEMYSVYEDKAAIAIEARKDGLALPAEVQEEAPAEEQPVAEKKAPVKAAPPPPSDGPAPWNEDEAKREERRLRALERKRKRAEKQGG